MRSAPEIGGDLSTNAEPKLPWYALKVRTNGEAKPMAALTAKGYDIFLPTYVDVRRYSDRLKKVPAALFPGYLFCRLDYEFKLPVLSTLGVEAIVGLGGTPTPIDEQEIAVIRKVTESGLSAMPWPYLKEGDRVKVNYGSMTGVVGTLIRVRGTMRVVISVHILQRSIAFEVDREWIRPL